MTSKFTMAVVQEMYKEVQPPIVPNTWGWRDAIKRARLVVDKAEEACAGIEQAAKSQEKQ